MLDEAPFVVTGYIAILPSCHPAILPFSIANRFMKILFADDARSVVRIMTDRLSSYGHTVVPAFNGQVAVDLFQQTAPDLIFMDVEMPVMNGFEATNRIRAIEARQLWAWTPIIFLTSSDTDQNLITAIEAGADDFMSKTVPEPVLRAKMKAMTRIAALRQRLSMANERLQDIANHDGLTGLANRRSMDIQVDALWDDAVTNRKSFGLLMIDIDNFKKYNDHYGHQAGDDCLRRVAQCIDATVQQFAAEGLAGAFAARYGGEEFAVVIPNCTAKAFNAISTTIVENVRILEIDHLKNDAWGKVTVSLGATRLPNAVGALRALFGSADERLYLAKKAGRNRAEGVGT